MRAIVVRAIVSTLLVAIPKSLIMSGAQTPSFSFVSQCLLKNGVAYGPFRDGQSPDFDSPVYPTEEQVAEDIKVLSRVTHRLRTYSATEEPFTAIPRLARASGVDVMQGVFLGQNRNENERQIASALKLAQDGLVDSLIVGNEVLTSKSVSKNDLLAYIRTVRAKAPRTVRVSTAEVWSVWQANPDLATDVDFVVAHFYPFWEERPIEGSAATLLKQYESLDSFFKKQHPGRTLQIVIGETGWPSGGPPNKASVPSASNHRKFLEEFTEIACERSIPFYYFSAFDEEWKWREGRSGNGDPASLPSSRTFSGRWIGSSWGLFQSNGRLKPGLEGLLPRPDRTSRLVKDVFVDGRLSAYLDMGVDTSRGRTDWLATPRDSLRMSYPAGQTWGAVFITVGTPRPRPRPSMDFSGFRTLSLELKGERGGEAVEVGIKDSSEPDDGREKKRRIGDLGTEYRTYDIPLSEFGTPRMVYPDDLSELYVVVEFVFSGARAQTVYARNIRYKP
jgi:exo-beta-1,3-glucanase (GH17 family)